MSSEKPKEIDSSGSVLFLGSGFSRSAKNIRGKNLPTARELKNELAGLLRIDSNDHDLKTLADEVAFRRGLNLIKLSTSFSP